MKKNILKGLVLVLGLVTCLGSHSFAANNIQPAPKQQYVVSDACTFKGHYELNREGIDELQNEVQKIIDSEISIYNTNFADVKIKKIKLDIKNNKHGKISILLDFKTNTDSGLDIYSRTCVVLDISQKDSDTFTFDMITKNCKQHNNLDTLDIKISKEFINDKECVVLSSSNSEIGKMVFEKVKK